MHQDLLPLNSTLTQGADPGPPRRARGRLRGARIRKGACPTALLMMLLGGWAGKVVAAAAPPLLWRSPLRALTRFYFSSLGCDPPPGDGPGGCGADDVGHGGGEPSSRRRRGLHERSATIGALQPPTHGAPAAPAAHAAHAASLYLLACFHVPPPSRSSSWHQPLLSLTYPPSRIVFFVFLTGVPLLLLTADRAPESRGTGANQAIPQPGLFGGFVRWAADVACPTNDLPVT